MISRSKIKYEKLNDLSNSKNCEGDEYLGNLETGKVQQIRQFLVLQNSQHPKYHKNNRWHK